MRALIEENRGGSVAWALTPLSKEAAKRLASEGFNANDIRVMAPQTAPVAAMDGGSAAIKRRRMSQL